MSYKISTLFLTGLIVFFTSVSHGAENGQPQNVHQLLEKKTQEAYIKRNKQFYRDSSTAIGIGCFNGSLPIGRSDFWCNHLATMAQDNVKPEDLKKAAKNIFGNRYSDKDIAAFVTEISNRPEI